MSKKIVLAFMGRSGAGKTTIINELINLDPSNYHEVISTTTRAARKSDTGYEYVDATSFEMARSLGQFAEHTTHGGHKYGIKHSNILKNKINLVALNLHGLAHLQANNVDYKCFSFYININRELSFYRMGARGDSFPSVKDRVTWDDHHFCVDNIIECNITTVLDGVLSIKTNTRVVHGFINSMLQIMGSR